LLYRTIQIEETTINKEIKFNETTCSLDAFRRGVGQKIVGFTFYGDINSDKVKMKGYFEGISEKLETNANSLSRMDHETLLRPGQERSGSA